MDIKKAEEILKREGWIVERSRSGASYKLKRPCDPKEPRIVRYGIRKGSGSFDLNRNDRVSPDAVIKMARSYISSNRSSTFKGNVKHYDARRNRKATQKLIHEERFDDIPLNDKVKEENRWNWD